MIVFGVFEEDDVFFYDYKILGKLYKLLEIGKNLDISEDKFGMEV